MKEKNLQLRNIAKTTMIALFLGVVGKMYSYDFSAICETGQTLYYNITDATNHYVELTCPGGAIYNGWSGYSQPTGNIIIPESVQHDDVAYSVTTIGSFAFSRCGGLSSLTLPNTVTSIGSNAFCFCSGLTDSLIIPNSVISIGESAFIYCLGFTNLTLGNSVTEIGYRAFSYCTGLDQIMVDSNNTTYDSRENCNAIIKTSTNELIVGCKNTVILNSVTSIGKGAFMGCSTLTGNLVIPNSVTTIGDYSFDGCSGLTGDLTIPNSVTTLGKFAFANCSGFMGGLTIGNSVTSISRNAFWGCSGLTGNLVIPNTVITIDTSAFNGCTGFTGDLIIPNSVTTIGEFAFNNCTGFNGGLTIGNSVTTIGNGVFWGCSGLTGNIVIPNSVTTIGDFAFDNCTGFTGSLTIGNSVTYLSGFEGCTGLTGNLTIPNTVTYIGMYAFSGCSGLKGSLTIPNSVTSIGHFAFSACSGFTGNLTIGNSVSTIGNSAFQNCSGFTEYLTIGKAVTEIGSDAFYGCFGLSEMIMLGTTPPSLGNYYVFSNTNGCPIYVPYESLYDYNSATKWSSYSNRIYPMAYTTISGYGEDTGNWRFIAFPLAETTTPISVDNMITESNYDLYRFDQSEDAEWRNYKANNFDLENGQGYLYANSEDVNIIFKGTFNEDNTKTVDLVYDANAFFAGWNLVGNPFPINAYTNKSYYTMNEDGTAIEPVAVSMGTAIPVCTGVMVKAENTGESVTFSKTALEGQLANQGVLQIAVAQNTTRGNSVQDKSIVSFNKGDELSKFVFNKDNAILYIPKGCEHYAIACAEKQGEMPLNLVVKENGSYTISVNPKDVEVKYLHLIDNLKGADVDLLDTPNYSFEAKTSDYASRFRLVFSASGNTDDENEEPFAFINNGNIIVTGDYANATLQIVDLTGHVVVSTEVANNTSINGIASGVYVLRLINGENVRTQKIVVH